MQQGSLVRSQRCIDWSGEGGSEARWGTSENNRRAKYYELTRAGRKQLDTEKDSWLKLTTAIAQILETT